MKNRPVRILYIAMQGTFLPLVLWLDDLRASGAFGNAALVFCFLTLLYMVDAMLFLWLIGKDERGRPA